MSGIYLMKMLLKVAQSVHLKEVRSSFEIQQRTYISFQPFAHTMSLL